MVAPAGVGRGNRLPLAAPEQRSNVKYACHKIEGRDSPRRLVSLAAETRGTAIPPTTEFFTKKVNQSPHPNVVATKPASQGNGYLPN
jgi:hypothetical protein